MVIISQKQDKTTESLEFNIDEITTCQNIFVSEDRWKKFKRIIGKENDYCNLKELKGLGEFLEKDMTKSIYAVREIKSNRIFGTYLKEEKAKQSLIEAIKAIKDKGYYQMLEDEVG